MWAYVSSDELYHYGVKGMRWGHRKKLYNELENARRKADRSRQKQKDYEQEHLDLKKINKSKDPYAYKKAAENLYYTDKAYKKLNDQLVRDNKNVSDLEVQYIKASKRQAATSLAVFGGVVLGGAALAGTAVGLYNKYHG